MESDDFASLGESQFLTVHLGGAKAGAERLLLVGRPYDGLVRVREWDSTSLNTSGDDYDIAPNELLDDIELAFRSSLGVRPEMYEIRLWLGGLE